MSRPSVHKLPVSPRPDLDAALNVDAVYGLEPVFEPQRGNGDGAPVEVRTRTVQCPHCGEEFETHLDPSSGSASYIEDCQICCRPIEFRLDVDDAGTLVALSLLRTD